MNIHIGKIITFSIEVSLNGCELSIEGVYNFVPPMVFTVLLHVTGNATNLKIF